MTKWKQSKWSKLTRRRPLILSNHDPRGLPWKCTRTYNEFPCFLALHGLLFILLISIKSQWYSSGVSFFWFCVLPKWPINITFGSNGLSIQLSVFWLIYSIFWTSCYSMRYQMNKSDELPTAIQTPHLTYIHSISHLTYIPTILHLTSLANLTSFIWRFT